MKIKFTRKNIANTLKHCAAAVQSGGILEMTSHLLVEIGNGVARFTANDLSLQITGTTPVMVEEGGAGTLPAKKFIALVNTFPIDAEITLESKGRRHTVRCGKGRYVLDGLEPRDFPLRQVDIVGSTGIDGMTLRKSMEFVAPFMAIKDIRYYLNGAQIDLADGGLTVVATDGHRMGMIRRDLSHEGRASMLLPNDTINYLISLLADYSGEVTINTANNVAEFLVGDYRVVSSLIDGKFPDWQRVIPTKTQDVVVPIRSAQEALKRAAIFSDEKYRGVRLDFDENKLGFVVPKEDAVSEDVEITGNLRHQCGINLHYLVDALSVLPGERARIGTPDPGNESSSLLVRSEGDEIGHIVIMPMRL